ncbi:MAG: Ig domain-containing protein [bacterium]|nr:Ig domain-containing protein [bacterium]
MAEPLALLTTDAPAARLNVPYTLNLLAAGGGTPYTWELAGTNGPLWLELDSETGVLNGLPDEAGNTRFEIIVSDAGLPAQRVTNQFVLVVDNDDGSVFIQTANLPPAFCTQPYQQPILVQGGCEPYTWELSSGALPDGITLSSNTGWLAGMPVATGATAFAVAVVDAGGATAERDFALHVFTVDTNAPVILPAELAPARAGQPVTAALRAIGLSAPLVWDTLDDLPEGIALDEDSGVLYGTPTTAEVVSFTVDVSDGNASVSRVYNWQISAATSALALIAADLPVGSPGIPYTQQVNAQGGTPPYIFAIVEGAVPSGMVFHTQTGGILGQTLSVGAFPLTVRVRDLGGLGATAYQHYLLRFKYASMLKIETAYLPTGRIRHPYNLALQRSGGISPYNWFLVNGAVPAGITLAPQGILSGTPVETGMFWCTLGLTSGDAQAAQQFYSWQIQPVPEALAFDTVMLPDGTAGKQYETRIAVRGGVAPHTWTIVTGAPPAGIALMPETGLLGGFPTETGTFPFVCHVSDQTGNRIDRSFAIHVAPAGSGLRFVTDILPPAALDMSYSEQIKVTGGAMPYHWQVVGGNLPPGMTFGTNSGAVFGAPGAAGTSTFIVAVQDATGASVARLFTLTVAAQEQRLSIDTETFDDGVQGEPYAETIDVRGGRLPLTWMISSGTLPPGLALSPTSGEITGTPTTFGAWAVTARVVDKLGSNVVQSYLVRILNSNDLAIVSDTLPYGKANHAYNFQLQASGGNPPLHWRVDDGSLPAGLTLSTNDGLIAGVITSATNDAATYYVDVTVEDAAQQQDTLSLALDLDTLDLQLVPAANFSVNWDYDKCDIDNVMLRFTAALPAGFQRFDSKTELSIWFADYEIAIDSTTAFLFNKSLLWKSKYGDARMEEGSRNDVPVVAAALSANIKKKLLTGTARVRFDDGIGSSFDLDDTIVTLITNFPVEVTLTVGKHDFVGHASVPVKYQRNAKGTAGFARSYKQKP